MYQLLLGSIRERDKVGGEGKEGKERREWREGRGIKEEKVGSLEEKRDRWRKREAGQKT